jgi:hypothetical protein
MGSNAIDGSSAKATGSNRQWTIQSADIPMAALSNFTEAIIIIIA